MNAHAPILTPLALENIDVLRALADNEFPSRAGLALYLNRDGSNVSRSLKALHGAGLINGASWTARPTAAGQAAMQAMVRAEAREAVPAPAPAANPAGVLVAHERIIPDSLNPRKHFDEAEVAELADSIARDDLLENLVIRPAETDAQGGGPFHRLVAGERRWRAIRLLIADGRWPKDKGVPCKVVDIDDAAHRRIALVENLQRKDLRPIDEANALKQLMELTGAGTAAIAEDIGFTQRFVQQRLQLLELPAVQQVALNEGAITIVDARRHIAELNARQEAQKAKALSPAELLAMAEVWHAIATRPVTLASYYGTTPVAVGYRALEEGDPLAALVKRGFLKTLAGWRDDARRFISAATWQFDEKDLEVQLPGFKSKDRDLVLNNLRRNVLGVAEAERLWDAKEYATWGLNPEFADQPDPSLEAEAQEWRETVQRQAAAEFHRNAARLEAEQAAEAKRAADKARFERDEGEWGRSMLAAVRDLELAGPGMDHAGFTRAFDGVLSTFGIAGPYAVHLSENGREVEIRDGQGVDTVCSAFTFEARRRLFALAMNYASGLPLHTGEDLATPWSGRSEIRSDEDTTLAEFLDLVAGELLDEHPGLAEQYETDEEGARDRADTMAAAGLNAYLSAKGVEFADPRYDWGASGARSLALGIVDDGLGQPDGDSDDEEGGGGEGAMPGPGPAEDDDEDPPILDAIRRLAGPGAQAEVAP